MRSFSAPTTASASVLLAKAKQAICGNTPLIARVKSPRLCMNIAVASMVVAASDWPARSAWKASAKLLKVMTLIGFRPLFVAILSTSRVRRSSMPPSSTDDALAGEIVDRLQPERIALGGEEADRRLLVGHHVHQLGPLLGPEDAGVDHVPALGGEARDHGGELGADVFRREAEPLADLVGELDPHALELALVVDELQRRQRRVDRHHQRAGLDDVGRRDLRLSMGPARVRTDAQGERRPLRPAARDDRER